MKTRGKVGANQFLESLLNQLAGTLTGEMNADVLTYIGPITYGSDKAIRDAVESAPERKDKLVVLLETNGGYIETVQRIVDILRKNWKKVEFIVPSHAMSAGTVLVMSGDAIYMDYYSVLGPIDPQVPNSNGQGWVPALGYLAQYERLIEKSRSGSLTTAELAILVKSFDQADLYKYEQARDLSITLLKKWLVDYKFKNWSKTTTRKIKVTKRMKSLRAVNIARILNDTSKWHSHARGISMEVLKRDLKLKIEDFGARPKLNLAVNQYYSLLVDYMGKMGHPGMLHFKEFLQPLYLR